MTKSVPRGADRQEAIADAAIHLVATRGLRGLTHRAVDTEAGLPDLLGRSLRTARGPGVVKSATTFRALGRSGLGRLTDRCCAAAEDVAGQIDRRPGLRLLSRPELSTVLFRPVAADQLDDRTGDELVAGIRRSLLASGRAVLGRATVAGPAGRGRLWLKLTLLNPHVTAADLTRLLDLVEQAADQLAGAPGRANDGASTPG